MEGKFKLLSVLCSLTHQIVRNCISITEILLAHCEKFYGPDSLEVSNIYFELGHYYNFMNQSRKAIACFLVAAKLRKEKAISSLYNVAVIFLRNNKYHHAIKYFTETLEMLHAQGDKYNIIQIVYMGLGNCYKKVNHFDLTVENFEKALCKLENDKRLNFK